MSSQHEDLMRAVRASVEAYCAKAHDHAFDPEKPIVRLHEPTFGAEEINAALECMLTTYVTMGPKVKAFEREFADKHGWRHGVMVNSGSSANLLAVAAIANTLTKDSLKPGDEVIVPALSWSTTVWPLIQLGLVPVIADLDPRTLNIDPNEIERAIGPKTRGVMIVPVYGNPCAMDAIVDICRRRNLVLIEDCCEALGATYDGKPVGKFGRVATFSFYYSHHITTFEGGICVTDDDDLAETMRILRAHGWVREVEDKQRWLKQHPDIDPKFLFVNVGYNLRATEPQGAMGSVQLKKLDRFVEMRRASAAAYKKALQRFDNLFAFQEETPRGRHSWFGFSLILREGLKFGARDLMAALGRANIESRPIIAGNIARQPALQHYAHRTVGDLKHSTAVMQRGFSFGNHQAIDDAARAYVVEHIAKFVSARG